MKGGFLYSLIARHSGGINQVRPRMPSFFESAGRGAEGIIHEEPRAPGSSPHPGEGPGTGKEPVAPFIVRNPDEDRYVERDPVTPPVIPRHLEGIRDIGNTSRESQPGVSLKAQESGTKESGDAAGDTRPKSTRRTPPGRETNILVDVKPGPAGEGSPVVEQSPGPAAKSGTPGRETVSSHGAEPPGLSEIHPVRPSRTGKSPGSPGQGQERDISRQDTYSGDEKAFEVDQSLESTRSPPQLSPITVIPHHSSMDRDATGNPDAPGQGTIFTPVSIRSLRPGVYTGEAGGNAGGETTMVREPTIHVTIGRIEVRAVPPPVSRQKEQAPRALTRLDEYLKRRDGSDRR